MGAQGSDLSTAFYCRRHFHLQPNRQGKHSVIQLHSAWRPCDNTGILRICLGPSCCIYLPGPGHIYGNVIYGSTAAHADTWLGTQKPLSQLMFYLISQLRIRAQKL